MTLIISDLSIEVTKKKMKQMRLSVKAPHGRVSVSAPLSMSDEEIEGFVRAKFNWIQKQVSKFDHQECQRERNYVSGETLDVRGKRYDLQVEHGNKNALVLECDRAILTVRKESTAKQRERYVRAWYREQLKTDIARLLPKWEKTTGLNASDWQTKYMTTRWGTCNITTKKLWFNLQLAEKTPACLEYVILHELCHLQEKNHGEKFQALMDQYMPPWREVKATLNGQRGD